MEETFQSYIARVKNCYKIIATSRVVKKHETDKEAIEFFEKFCNESLPKGPHENEMKNMIRELYNNNKDAFATCVSQSPYLFLLTEARAIVMHFDIQNVVYIKWNNIDKKYLVEKNIKQGKSPETFKSSGKNTKLNKFKELLQRVESLEKKIPAEDIQVVEPDLTEDKKESEFKIPSEGKLLWGDETMV